MGNTLVVGTGNNFAVIQGRTDGASGSTNGVNYGGSYGTNPINGARMLVGAAGGAGQRGLITFNTKNTDDDTNQPTEKMRIAADGNVGIGTTSPTGKLTVSSDIDVLGSNFANVEFTGASVNGSGVYTGLDSGGGYVINVRDSGYIGFSTTNAERMRITSDGRLLAGTTTSYGRLHSANISFNPGNAAWLTGASFVSSGSFGGGYALLDGSAGYSMYCAESGSDFFIQHHSSTTAGGTGGVKLDNAATSWTSASDEREKENLVGITDATTKIKSLRTVIGNYTWQPDVKHAFLIAQDVQTVLPEAVSVVNKSATTDEQRLGIRYTEVIPLLTAALKESLEKIEALEARITALEAE
jgi:hypothetical protein